jgi:hypothetical protein
MTQKQRGVADATITAASPILHEASGRSGSGSVAEAEVFLRGLRGFPPAPYARRPPGEGPKQPTTGRNQTPQTPQTPYSR